MRHIVGIRAHMLMIAKEMLGDEIKDVRLETDRTSDKFDRGGI